MSSRYVISVNWGTPSITNKFIIHLLKLSDLDETRIIIINNSPEDNLSFTKWTNNPKIII